MKLTVYSALLAAAAALFLFGCESDRVVVEHRHDIAEAHNPAGQAMEAIEAYEFEHRDLVVNNLQAVLSELDRRITDFRGQSKSIASDKREDWNETLTELEQTRDELEVVVERVKFSTRDTWDDVKDSALEGLEDVQEQLEELQETAAA